MKMKKDRYGNALFTVIPAYDFASALALSESECPCGAQAGIQFE